MDFYYPGKEVWRFATSQGFCPKWHPLIMKQLPQIELTLLIGKYAQDYYLGESHRTVTERVQLITYPPIFPTSSIAKEQYLAS